MSVDIRLVLADVGGSYIVTDCVVRYIQSDFYILECSLAECLRSRRLINNVKAWSASRDDRFSFPDTDQFDVRRLIEIWSFGQA